MGVNFRNPSTKDKYISRRSLGILLVVFVLGTFLPSLAQAAPKTAPLLDVIINEVAWAGTDIYFGHEWIELYNSGTVDVDIDGWTLVTASTSVEIIIDPDDDPTTPTIIPAGGYFLLERKDGDATSAMEDMVYDSGFLSDDGEVLLLLDRDHVTRDTANADSDSGRWSHGSISPASSMERMSKSEDTVDNWVTNINPHPTIVDDDGGPIYGTPREANWGYTVSYTPVPPPTVAPTKSTSLDIVINEIAWAGTKASSDDEWIELYNTTSNKIDLSGWKLTSNEGLNIELSGEIEANGYFLLERRKDAADNVPTFLYIVADQIYIDSHQLADSGEYLRLIDTNSNNKVVDTANRSGGSWDAGSGSPDFYSMERREGFEDGPVSWISNVGYSSNGFDKDGNPINGTPGKQNWAALVLPTPSPVPTRTPIPPTRTPTPYPFQSVVLNEILPRPGHDWNGDGVVDVNDEFIEIINRGEYEVSLGGWRLDDEYDQGSAPYALPNISLRPGNRIAIFGFTSHISLSDGGDTVRLLKSNGQVADAVTYTVIKAADRSWCRLPENGFWNTACFPTPNEENSGLGDFLPLADNLVRASCFVPDTTSKEIIAIECGLLGMSIYNSEFWGSDQPGYWLTGQSKYSTWFH